MESGSSQMFFFSQMGFNRYHFVFNFITDLQEGENSKLSWTCYRYSSFYMFQTIGNWFEQTIPFHNITIDNGQPWYIKQLKHRKACIVRL